MKFTTQHKNFIAEIPNIPDENTDETFNTTAQSCSNTYMLKNHSPSQNSWEDLPEDKFNELLDGITSFYHE